MVLERIGIWLLNTLQYLYDNACKSIFIEVDLLMIRNLTNVAERSSAGGALSTEDTDLTSAKELGRFATILPPNKSTE